MSEQRAVEYINGEHFVPAHVWPLVKRYRALAGVIETAGDLYPKKVDQDMNALFDAMLVL